MRRRRKKAACLNCGHILRIDFDNYCPKCGQENTNVNISFGQLLYDFLNNAFAFDGRFVNSIKPFFFKPGWLTLRFNEGKRVSYANPLRLYLVISLFYFFVLNIAGKKITQDINSGISNGEKVSDVNPANNIITGQSIYDMADSLSMPDSVEARLSRKIRHTDTLGTEKSTELRIGGKQDAIDVNIAEDSDGNIFGISADNWTTYDRLRNDQEISDDMLYDSLDLTRNSGFERFFMRQVIRVNRADNQTIADLVTKNLPVLMFIMLPLFALLLKLLYVRRNILYVQHIIHTIHLHCFAYIIYGLCIAVLLMGNLSEELEEWVTMISFLLVSVYAYASFLSVYDQGWFKTLVKFMLVGWLYVWCLTIGFVLEMLISFLVF